MTDDDVSIREIFKIIFERANYEVNLLPDAEDLLSNNFVSPDLILLDRQLSGYDGLDVCRFLKGQQNTKNIPIIIISASPDIGKLAKNAGADYFVEKPFQVNYLLEVVERFI